MEKKEQYIAVIDSGVGGISVLKLLRQALPQEKFLYFGDSANAPYGVRTPEQIRALTHGVVEKLLPRGIKALVIACNTATAAALDSLRQTYPELIICGIAPALELAVEKFPGGRIGVMATPATISGEKLQAVYRAHAHKAQIHLLPAAGLADLVEANKQNGPEGEALLRQVLGDLVGQLDALVLGCTHYPFAVPMLKKIMGPDCLFLDGGALTTAQLCQSLEQQALLRTGEGELLLENSVPGQRMTDLSRTLLEMEIRQ